MNGKMAYKFARGSRIRGDANRAGREIELVRKQTGSVTKRAVAEAARSESMYIHRYFTWDDSKAADKWREEEAGKLLQAIVEVHQGIAQPVRAYVALSKGGYQKTVKVMRDADGRAELLKQALEELRWFKEKYSILKELAGVFEAIEEARRAA